MHKTFLYKIDNSNTLFIVYYPRIDNYVLNVSNKTKILHSKKALIEEVRIFTPEIVDQFELDLAEYLLLGE